MALIHEGQNQNIKDIKIGSDYLRMFKNIGWNTKLEQDQEFDPKDPHFHLIKAIKTTTKNQPSKIRKGSELVSYLERAKADLVVLDGYNKQGKNFYEAYKTFVDANLHKTIYLLTQWNLDQYINVLNENGWDEVEDWGSLKIDDLKEMEFDDADAQIFLSKAKAYLKENT